MNQPELPLYTPGVILPVGSHQAKILKYLTSGGFAQVYQVEIAPYDVHSGSNIACLKRVIVPDKASLNVPRAEVEAMKLLRHNKHVVSYIDSHAAKSNPSPGVPNGSYEVFLLMEFCSGKGLIDFMNTRLRDRLQEFEILNIMSQVSQGVAAMHALQPPLLHRDIKIENVLISNKNEYKLCDFGSVCGVIRPPTNQQEMNFVQHDIMKNTTAQYRSPEMLSLSKNIPIDEKSDIWALGVFLYKLCYYTTPFEKEGENAILHSRFQYPAYPRYSDNLKNLIRVLLMVQPSQRPNICQVVEEVSRLQGVQCPLKNFYLERAIRQTAPQNKQPHHGMEQFPPLHLQHSISTPSLSAVANNNAVLTNATFSNSTHGQDSGYHNITPRVNNNPYTINNSTQSLNYGQHVNAIDQRFSTTKLPNLQINSSAYKTKIGNLDFEKHLNSTISSTSISDKNIVDYTTRNVSKEPSFQRTRSMPNNETAYPITQKEEGGRGKISSILNFNKTSFDKTTDDSGNGVLSSKSSKVDLTVFNDNDQPPYIKNVLPREFSVDNDDDDIYITKGSQNKSKEISIDALKKEINELKLDISNNSQSQIVPKTDVDSRKVLKSKTEPVLEFSNNLMKKSSITDRYLNSVNNKEDSFTKTAEGYGKYTKKTNNDKSSTEKKTSFNPLPSEIDSKHNRKITSNKTQQKAPPKLPSKPSYLGGKKL